MKSRKVLFSLMLALVLVLCAGVAFAWNPSVDDYTINNLADLKAFRDAVDGGNTFGGKNIELKNDIDLNNEEWNPIGDNSKVFAGHFNGNGKTIANLVISKGLNNTSANNYVGLFAQMSGGSIKNLTINNADVQGSLYVSAVCGIGNTTIDNVKVTGKVTIDAWWYAGTILGNGYSNITNCHVNAQDGSYVKGNNGSYIGGIVGFRGEGSQKISDCSVNNLDISGVDRVGGICGITHYSNTTENCTVSNMSVAASDPNAKSVGLVSGANLGDASNPNKIINNTSSNNVSASAGGTPVTTQSGSGNHMNQPVPTNGSVVGTNVKTNDQGEFTEGTFEFIPEQKIAEDILAVSVTNKEQTTISLNKAAEDALESIPEGSTVTISGSNPPENISVPSGVTVNNKTDSSIKVNGNTVSQNQVTGIAPKMTTLDGTSFTTVTYAGNNLYFRSTAAFKDFVKVLFDGKELDSKNYNVYEGSIVVELKKEFIQTLPGGTHTLSIVSKNAQNSVDSVSGSFVVEVSLKNRTPQTGDNSQIALWILLMAISAVSFVALVRKSRFN